MPRKLPKSMGLCADLLWDARQKRLAADKVAAELKAEEIRISKHIIDNLSKNDTGAAGKHHRVQVVTKPKLRVNAEQWNKFYAWVRKNDAFDVLQKRLNEPALIEHMTDKKGNVRLAPGVEQFQAVSVSLTKV